MSDDLKEKLREIMVEVSEIDDIPDDTSFSDLGIDSMMAIEIVSDVERAYSIKISEEELAELTNFMAVYEKVKEKLG